MKKLVVSLLSFMAFAFVLTSCGKQRAYETVDGDPMQSRIYTLYSDKWEELSVLRFSADSLLVRILSQFCNP